MLCALTPLRVENSTAGLKASRALDGLSTKRKRALMLLEEEGSLFAPSFVCLGLHSKYCSVID